MLKVLQPDVSANPPAVPRGSLVHKGQVLKVLQPDAPAVPRGGLVRSLTSLAAATFWCDRGARCSP